MIIYLKNINDTHCVSNHYYEYVNLDKIERYATHHSSCNLYKYIILDGIYYEYNEKSWNEILDFFYVNYIR